MEVINMRPRRVIDCQKMFEEMFPVFRITRSNEFYPRYYLRGSRWIFSKRYAMIRMDSDNSEVHSFYIFKHGLKNKDYYIEKFKEIEKKFKCSAKCFICETRYDIMQGEFL